MRLFTSKAKDSKAHVNEKGISWLLASVFIVGDMAGGGMIAMPHAFANLGLIPGIILLLLCAFFATHTGLQLSWNWNMMQNRWPEYKETCRKPYGEMAYRAIGPRMRGFLAIVMCLSQFGLATVLILLAAKNLSILLHFFFGVNVNTCYLIVIVGLAVWPGIMLQSPMHFWQFAVFSAASSSIAVLLLIIGMVHDASACSRDVLYEESTLLDKFMSFGTLCFAFGGHAAFPTIQHDMVKPAHFFHSVLLSFFACTVYYLTVSIFSFYIYGDAVGDAVIPSIQLMWIQQLVNLMIALHVVTTIVIIFSPLMQHFEHICHVPNKFGVKRFLLRTVLFWAVVFVALSMPHFGPVMDLFGASGMCLICMVLPSIFYLSLYTSTRIRENQIAEGIVDVDDVDDRIPSWKEISNTVPRPILIFNIISLAFGIVGGAIATISAIISIQQNLQMAPPCYVQYFTTAAGQGIVNCCGTFRNITVFPGTDPEHFCSLEN